MEIRNGGVRVWVGGGVRVRPVIILLSEKSGQHQLTMRVQYYKLAKDDFEFLLLSCFPQPDSKLLTCLVMKKTYSSRRLNPLTTEKKVLCKEEC